MQASGTSLEGEAKSGKKQHERDAGAHIGQRYVSPMY